MAAPSKGRRGAGTRSGSNSGVQVVGLKEFRQELRKLEEPKYWTKELSAANRRIGKQAAEWARSEASGMGGVHAKFAGQIRGYGSAASARVGVLSTANAAFWGAKKRTGWNAGNETPNLPDWVGNSWDVGVRGQGPYALNAAIADHIDRIIDMYGDAIDDITDRAFPD